MDELKLNEIKREDIDDTQGENEPRRASDLPTEATQKSITDLSVRDIKTTLDTSKSMEEQAEDIVGAMATAAAVQDEKTAEELKENKAEELKAKSRAKATAAEAQEIKAHTERQKASNDQNETILSILNIKSHLPKWAEVIIKPFAFVLYFVFSLTVGLIFGIAGKTIDCIDNVIVRYQDVDDKNKPKLKVTVWILLIALVLGGVALVVLKCLGKI